jgi:outer membrane immunogenic protein
MQKTCAGVILATVVSLGSNALADGLYAPGGFKDAPAYVPAVSWTGYYMGINAGYGWSGARDQLSLPSIYYYDNPALRAEGGFGGGQIGYNWAPSPVYSRLVLGLEADFQGSSISDSQNGAYDGYSRNSQSRLDWFGTVRGRLGYTMNNALVYATGGFAYGGVTNQFLNSYSGGNFIKNTTAAGYVLGIGVEYKLNPSWSLKAEYQYINLGENNPVNQSTGETFTAYGGIVRDDDYHTVRLGLNYYLQPFYEPLK